MQPTDTTSPAANPTVKEDGFMWARVARFQTDPDRIDPAAAMIRTRIEDGDLPPELSGVRFLLLGDRESGAALGISLFETEEAMREGDAVLNAQSGEVGGRSSVEFYEVALEASS